jgi:hypothetical protein
MNEGNESILPTETRKKKRRSRFRFSSKKALQRSRLTRSTAKAGGSKFTSVTRALLYPSAFSSEIIIFDHHDCAGGSGGTHCLELID